VSRTWRALVLVPVEPVFAPTLWHLLAQLFSAHTTPATRIPLGRVMRDSRAASRELEMAEALLAGVVTEQVDTPGFQGSRPPQDPNGSDSRGGESTASPYSRRQPGRASQLPRRTRTGYEEREMDGSTVSLRTHWFPVVAGRAAASSNIQDAVVRIADGSMPTWRRGKRWSFPAAIPRFAPRAAAGRASGDPCI
jgi:hypothetical protein